MLNIIIVSDQPGRSRTFSLSKAQIIGGIVALSALLIAGISGMIGLILSPTPSKLGLSTQRNVPVEELSVRLGQLQAQLIRLEGLSERLAKKTGIDPREFNLQTPPPRGGADASVPARHLSLQELTHLIEETRQTLEDRFDRLSVLDNLLVSHKIEGLDLPRFSPVNTAWSSSNFGWRLDPFHGKKTFHEGIDFAGPIGTPVLAAGGGKVGKATFHPQYGNMVEIEHGNGLMTRYAHLSRLSVNEGETVKTGEQVGLLGNTGRSTGPHLHFEVRYHSLPQNPARFLTPRS